MEQQPVQTELKIPRLGYRTFDEAVAYEQRRNFEDRYVGASLAGIRVDEYLARKVLDYIKQPKHMLVYHGSPGIGKTYFCAALIPWAIQSFNSYRYYNEKNLLSKLRKGISNGEGDYAEALEYLIDDDLVMLDDVASSINPSRYTTKDLEWRREIFFNFLDIRYNKQLPTIITSNLTEKEFQDVYSERICSRLFAKENTIISIFGGQDKRKIGM